MEKPSGGSPVKLTSVAHIQLFFGIGLQGSQKEGRKEPLVKLPGSPPCSTPLFPVCTLQTALSVTDPRAPTQAVLDTPCVNLDADMIKFF